MKHFITPYLLGIVLATAALLGGHANAAASLPGTTTTVVLVRHAERTAVTKELTEKGRARAGDLRDQLASARVSAIYAPDLARNIDTARPLAELLNIDITLVPENPDIDALVATFLTQHAGSTVLWVGNTNNLKQIFTRLGGTGEAPGYYDDMYFVTVNDQGQAQVLRARYGEPGQ